MEATAQADPLDGRPSNEATRRRHLLIDGLVALLAAGVVTGVQCLIWHNAFSAERKKAAAPSADDFASLAAEVKVLLLVAVATLVLMPIAVRVLNLQHWILWSIGCLFLQPFVGIWALKLVYAMNPAAVHRSDVEFLGFAVVLSLFFLLAKCLDSKRPSVEQIS